MQKITVIKESKNPKVLVVTPLLPGHKISKETKVTIKRNSIPLTWISSMGRNNIPTNLQKGLEYYEGKLPPYYIMIDNDIILGRHMIDRMVGVLDKRKSDNIAFAYASFKFKGVVDKKFPAEPYAINRLLQHNYISSNSLFRSNIVMNIGLVTDNNYVRLLDWCMLLKLLYHGYYGMPCPNANFIAKSSESDISAGSNEDYEIKRYRVLQDFGHPIVERYGSKDSQHNPLD